VEDPASVAGGRPPVLAPGGEARYQALRAALRTAAPFCLALFDESLAVLEADPSFAAATAGAYPAATAAALFGSHAARAADAIRHVLATGSTVENVVFELPRPPASVGLPPRRGYRVTFYPVPAEGAPVAAVGAMLWELSGVAGAAGYENSAGAALRRVAQALPAMVVALDRSGSVIFANGRWATYIGDEAAAYALDAVRAAVHPADRAAFDGQLQVSLAREGNEAGPEFRLRRHDGEYRWHQLRLSPVLDDDGREPLAYVGIAVDVHDRRLAEEQQSEALNRARALTDALPVFVIEIPLDGRPMLLNQAAREYLQARPDELARLEDWRQLVHPDDRAKLPTIADITRLARPTAMEFRLRGGNGEYRWFEGRATPVFGGDGRVASWIALAHDIHERKAAEEAPARERRRLRAVFAQMPAGVVWFDVATEQMTGNPQVARIWRMDPAPTGPDDPRMRGFSLDGRPYAPEDWPLRRVLRTGEEVAGEIIRIVRGDGTDGYLNVNAGPVRDRDGTMVAVVLAFEDITAFVQAERALHETYSQLTHLYEAAPVGLAFLSPDLRFERVNEALAEMNGTTVEAQTGRTLRDVLPDLADTLEPVAATVLREGRAVLGVETRRPHPSRPGELCTYLRSYYPVRADDGHVLGIGVLVTDVTDQRKAEEAMRLSEERYRTLTNTVPQPVWSCDASGRVTFFNSRWYEYTGLSPALSLGHAWLDAVHPDDAPRVREAWDRSVREGREHTDEMRIRRADGEARWHLARVLPLTDDVGRVLGWFGTATDIHERRIAALAEEVLANIGAATVTEPDAAALVSAIAACLVPALGDYCVVDIRAEDERVERLAARHADPARAGDMRLALSFGPRSIHDNHPAARVMRTGEAEIVERAPASFGPRLGRDAAARDVLARLNPRAYLALPLRAHGRVIGTLSLLTSGEGHEFTTEEVALAEEAARRTALAVSNARLNERTREAEQLYRTLLDVVPQVVWLAGPNGGAFYYNRRWREYTGDPEGSGRHASTYVLPEDLPAIAERWKVSLETSEPFECEYRLRGRDGEYRWFLARAVAMFDDRGERTGWLGTGVDIEEIKRAQVALQRANQLKDEFLGLVSHELRTPLTSILGHGSVLLRHGATMSPEDRAASLDDIIHEAERLQRLVENMLVLAGVEGRQEVVTEPLLVQHAIPRVVALHHQAHPARIVEVRVAPGLDAVEAQPTYFDQVLSNLLSNAEKYSPPALPITVMADAEGAEVVVRVCDHGVGITDEEAAEIFKPFFRSARTATSAPGAGLGLAVCMRLIEAQGGRIWAAPRPGGGTEFGFALRAVLADTD